MKKQFGKISAKPGKKNGAAVFACAVILAMSLGTLAGCSVTPGSPAAAPAPPAASSPAGASNPAAVPDPSGAGNMQAENLQSDSPLQGTSDAALITAAFVPGMGCSDPACTDAAHHHDCPADCADYEHHHTCALDCTEAGHHHGGTASGNSGNPGGSGNSGVSGNSNNTGSTGGHHNDSGHHSDRHHG